MLLKKNPKLRTNKFVVSVLYVMLYEFIYLLQFFIIMGLIRYFLFPIFEREFPGIVIDVINFSFLIIFWLSFIFGGFRAKFAIDEFCNSEKSFFESHKDSKYHFNLHLSFLPVIGKLFEIKENKNN